MSRSMDWDGMVAVIKIALISVLLSVILRTKEREMVRGRVTEQVVNCYSVGEGSTFSEGKGHR